jgi:hypothetical protein
MSAPKRANDIYVAPCWKVRVVMRGGGLLHFLSKNEPVVDCEDGLLMCVQMELICGTEHGDTLGYICWPEVSAVTWRFAPLATQ